MKPKLIVGIWLVCSMVFAGCGQLSLHPAAEQGSLSDPPAAAASQDEKTQIKGSITLITNRTDLVDTKFKAWEVAFKQKYPLVEEVKVEAIKDYEGTMKVRLSTGELGDISMIPNNIPPSQLSSYYIPLDDLGLNDRLHFADWKAYAGTTYGLPSGMSTNGIIYNKKAYAQAGITELPSTLEAFYAVCDKLKAAGITPFATNFKDKWPLQEWDYLAFAISGDPTFRGQLTGTDAPFAHGTPYERSLRILKTLISKGDTEPSLMSTDWEASKQAVAEGKTAMYLLGSWVIPQLIDSGAKPEEIGFYPLPYDQSGEYYVNFAPDYAFGVSVDSPNKETAKAFVKFMLEQSDYADASGLIPPMREQEPKLPQLTEFFSRHPKILKPMPDPDLYTKISNKAQIDFFGGIYIQSVVLKYKDLEEGLEELNQRWSGARKRILPQ